MPVDYGFETDAVLAMRCVLPACLMCVHARLQLATAQASVERLQQQVAAGQPEMTSLRAHVEQLDKELQEAKVCCKR